MKWKCDECDNQAQDKECLLGEDQAARCMTCGWMLFERREG